MVVIFLSVYSFCKTPPLLPVSVVWVCVDFPAVDLFAFVSLLYPATVALNNKLNYTTSRLGCGGHVTWDGLLQDYSISLSLLVCRLPLLGGGEDLLWLTGPFDDESRTMR